MTITNELSNLMPALERLTQSSARGMVARARLASPGLNRWLLRALAEAPPGQPGALLAQPLIETAKEWQPADETMDDLTGALLNPTLIAALASAGDEAIPRDRHPYMHQLAAWQESLINGRSTLVTAGTGAGKTESFLIPILEDILANPRIGGGVRAILLYPLNALIESQRERLSAWARGLDGKVRFALLNKDTAETERKAREKSDRFELRSREMIRKQPPEILVTNITMLEYLLLRSQDRPILEASEGALRWIVLDEAHSYVGSQAAEMALLLRRVRAGFGVTPDDTRLMATSATIGGELDATDKLRAFAAALAGQPEDRIAVIEGLERPLPLPPVGPDTPLDGEVLSLMPADDVGALLASHPRLQSLRKELAVSGLGLDGVARHLFGDPARMNDAADLLDQAGRALWHGKPVLPWRAHLFHRAQGGLWACPDAGCPHQAPELAADGGGWPFGAAWLAARARCDCGAPVYEVVACSECGTLYLQGLWTGGAQPHIRPPDPGEGDDFALDVEPDDDDAPTLIDGMAWLAPGAGVWVDDDGRVWDNAPPEGYRARPLRLIEYSEERACCARAGKARLMGLKFGPAFFMGNALSGVLEDLVPPAATAGLPAGGRRALSFSDSRQGVARLAAKLQQESERTLTRAYLWHRVQQGSQADPEQLAKLRSDAERLRDAGIVDMAEDKEREIAKLIGVEATTVKWSDLVQGLANHPDLREFAVEVWRPRWLGEKLVEDPRRLATAFLFRELLRRPRVQNNPETMGLLRLTFPELEAQARMPGSVPKALAQAGIDNVGWLGLALIAVDRVFRQNLAVEMDQDLVPLVAPRSGVLKTIVATDTRKEDMEPNAKLWPGPKNGQHRLVQTIYTLIGGSADSAIDQDRVGEALDALWRLITSKAARDVGKGGYQLDYMRRAAVARLDRGWLCPVTRRIFGHSLAGRSPIDPVRTMAEVAFPRLPEANAGGLTREKRAETIRWINSDDGIAGLRNLGIWTNLHDRLATFPPYMRAQEHSAQIERPVLRRYEEDFSKGRINLLNCSTTMEMGVDIANVRLVVNSNVPPALSNYRQRAGRAGRRGEPWAFTLTFCRDLPLDQRVFADPAAFLTKPIMAPKVWLDSASLVQRHVNAALMTVWLGERGGTSVFTGIGAFLGAGKTLEDEVQSNNEADTFLNDLSSGWGKVYSEQIGALVGGTALSELGFEVLAARTHDVLDKLVTDWRREYRTLLEGAEGADGDAKKAMELRASRLAGEFLLGELARRGFTPSYGFPTDVVSFANLAHQPSGYGESEARPSHFRSGAASRPLDQAIREYAPGAEVVIDGLVHKSEGVMPAWEAGADTSRLEDLRTLWTCGHCHAFGLETTEPAACPQCRQPLTASRKILRPVGFLGAKKPHVSYESLAFSALDPVQISAQQGDWLALPAGVGRMRTDPSGQVATSTAGKDGGGFAICLDCGRAEPMVHPSHGMAVALTKTMTRHYPLLRSRNMKLTHDGRCPATSQLSRIQRHVHLAQVKRTDVWEWQLPPDTAPGAAMALAAALREALAERLGVEAAEMSPVVSASTGPANEERLSLFLHDRAAGGAGLVARMVELDVLEACLARARELLDCSEGCRRGCPACILRPDLNQQDLRLDRPAGSDLAGKLAGLVTLEEQLRVLGPQTRLAGQSAARLLGSRIRSGQVQHMDIWLHGDPAEWDMPGWSLRGVLAQAIKAGLRPRIHLDAAALTARGFDLDCQLALHSLTQGCDLHMAAGLPLACGLPIVSRVGRDDEQIALVTADSAEALPGPDWAAGAIAPLLVGPAPEIDVGSQIPTNRLIKLGTGNAHLVELRGELDGSAAEFGKRFWKTLSLAAPLEIAAMQNVGVVRLTYSDRYLLQAYTLALLHSVLRATPGAGKARLEVRSAYADRLPIEPRRLFDSFPTDTVRQEVLRALLPAATVTLDRKQELAHYRIITAELRDGRCVRINLDQGFGWWQVAGAPMHDFDASVAIQANLLKKGEYTLRGNVDYPVPVTITMR